MVTDLQVLSCQVSALKDINCAQVFTEMVREIKSRLVAPDAEDKKGKKKGK